MVREFISDTKKSDIWLISHLKEPVFPYAFHALEAGEFSVKGDMSGRNFGRRGYLLIFSCCGEGELIYYGKSYKLPGSSVALIDCENWYELKSAGEWYCYWLSFTGSGSGFFRDAIYSDGFFTASAGTTAIKDTFERIMRDIINPGVEARFRISNDISALLTYLVDSRFSQSAGHSRNSRIIGQTAEYIRENYSVKLDIEQLASMAGLSKYYFIKLFKEFMGVAPYEYLITYRINEAKKQLRSTRHKISQISEYVGFNDECNFIRTFKRATGKTPSQYRDEERAGRRQDPVKTY